MKATYVWRDGAFAGREVVLAKVKRIEIGPAGAERLEVPGSAPDAVRAVVTFENGRCYVTAAGETGIRIFRKVSGELKEIPVGAGAPTETKSHDVLCLGPEGPTVYSLYELEVADRFGLDLQQLPEAVSPASADRRQHELQVASVAKKQELLEIEKKADVAKGQAAAASKIAKHAHEKLEAEHRQVRWKLWAVAALVLVGLGVVTVFFIRAVQQTEERVAGLSRAIADSRSGYEKNMRVLESVRREAQRELDAFQAEYQELLRNRQGNEQRLAEIQRQMENVKLELRENSSVEKTFQAMQKDVDAALFLIVVRIRTARPAFYDERGQPTTDSWSMGTGFVIDAEGRMVTCKHVTQPWKFGDTAALIARAQTSVVDSYLEAYPVGHRFGDTSVEVATTANGRLRVVRTAADQMERVTMELGGSYVSCDVESNYENDIAILQLRNTPFKPLRLATDAELRELQERKLWPVMVAGFPMGVEVMENGRVESSMTLGNVRKFEKFIQYSAPTCSGNSGGPVIDQLGRVVGVVSFMRIGEGTQNLNSGVPVSHVNKLLR